MASILILDDNRDLAEATAQLLAAFGHDVDVARDCDEAMREIARAAPDTVIVDIGLPVIDGFEVARRLRATYARRLRLIAYTAWSDEATRLRAADAGFDGLLVKPASIGELLDALAEPDAGASGRGDTPRSPSGRSRSPGVHR
jgi:DNA-binding response OmpR family regulator